MLELEYHECDDLKKHEKVEIFKDKDGWNLEIVDFESHIYSIISFCPYCGLKLD